MNSAKDSVRPIPQRRSLARALGAAAASPRVGIYLACTLLAVAASFLLGKDVRWDTLDYHLYAGFSALHDRFSRDYFPAGAQSYFNPYVYVPFYLLAVSGLPALAAASILAVVQSAILWLTYELTLEVALPRGSYTRMTVGLCAVALAFVNPILLNQFGSSFVDIITAEVVVLGWLLLVRAIRVPRLGVVCIAGALLGIASALKLTNSVHALSASVLVLFLPLGWRARIRYALCFAAAVAVSLAIVSAPWSVRLEEHFGNPLFPLLNSIFRSPQFPTSSVMDYRFVPDSIAEALWRPFALLAPLNMVDDEFASPDPRYAVLLVAGCLLLLRWAWGRLRPSASVGGSAAVDERLATRALVALACGFLVDWTFWLTVSGNGRYFIAMACVAAVLGVVMVFRLFASRPKAAAYVIAAILGAQAVQLYIGADYRYPAAWQDRPWFDVSVPKALARQPSLYFSFGIQSNSFLVPFLARGSGFVNLAGDYVLGADGPNGAHIESLIRRYSPHVRILTRDSRRGAAHDAGAPSASLINDALEPFGLSLNQGDCSKIVVRDGSPPRLIRFGRGGGTLPPAQGAPASNTDYYVSCGTVSYSGDDSWYRKNSREVNLVLDRVEDACPQLFQPRRPVTQFFGDKRQGGIWERQYEDTSLAVWVSRGWVNLTDPLRGGSPTYLGRERDWASASRRLECGRRGERYFARLVSAREPGGR